MMQTAMRKISMPNPQTCQTMCLVVDGNSHAADLHAFSLPKHPLLISEALVPHIRVVAMLIAAQRVDFGAPLHDFATEEADWFAARMLVLNVSAFHLDVSLLPMLQVANERAQAFAKAHGLVFEAAKIKMSLHANRANNMLLVDVAANTLALDGGLLANSLALRAQVSLQSGLSNLM